MKHIITLMENQTLLTVVPMYANKLRKDCPLFTGVTMSVCIFLNLIFG